MGSPSLAELGSCSRPPNIPDFIPGAAPDTPKFLIFPWNIPDFPGMSPPCPFHPKDPSRPLQSAATRKEAAFSRNPGNSLGTGERSCPEPLPPHLGQPQPPEISFFFNFSQPRIRDLLLLAPNPFPSVKFGMSSLCASPELFPAQKKKKKNPHSIPKFQPENLLGVEAEC